MLGNRAHESLQPPSNLEERKGFKDVHRHPGRCGDTVGTCDAVQDVLRHCSSHCTANSPYLLQTFPSAEPSNGMGTTLGSGPDLDQDRALPCRTLGTSPRHAWRTVPPTATTTPSYKDVGAISARPRTTPRTTAMPDAMPHSVLSTVLDHCTPAIRGEDDDFHNPLCMYTARPCVYKRRRRALSWGDRS